ncbi:ABC transporter ATP-binding protein [Campylobacter hyointestinalis]|uniref:ABC transporter ATP-binding protein n=1 Tax=Campylobacter hyointestinalis TaxID=198 RepID=UPI000DCCD1E3|nr:ABC transporter ATP-binding protein [Campylobacter hyointestinalis]RAZ49753.1 ABC transporter ATP-binding protein [Campylobacter hyointestinalis subsp. lawsonii]RAZ55683.1 ABC transporter ATP-binding protein [Campylobacter hyointestinalis subsp. lawsonii]RAZ64431.1 ABC transporter ATP-binding protein [Campylobacter hyointestinalis subsp. lawsonii]
MIKLVNLNVKYAKKEVLKQICFEFEGGILNILGENGSGKSSLLKAILGLIKFSGDVLINRANLRSFSSRELASLISYIPQSNFTPFNYSVLDMVLMGRLAYKGFFDNYSKNDRLIAIQSLEILGILNLVNDEFLNLSGGQKQLVLIARALASRAKTIIMDEPINGLDFGNQIRLLEMIKMVASSGYDFIITTHHPRHARFIGGRAILIKNGEILKDTASELLDSSLISKLYGVDYKKYEELL